jgi:manganese transport system ATP-binding protein
LAPAISVKDLYVSYYGKEAISGINLSVETENLIGIIGPNGAGKSTFLKALLNLIQIDRGEVEICGNPIHKIRKKIAYVPQRNQIDWDFPILVLDTVLLGTYPNLGILKRPKKKDKEWAYECLKKVGMEKYAKRQIGELSGGQQQRVFLARALAQEAEIFFLDEPFVGIDMSSEETIISLLKELRNEGKTVVVVHHDLSKASEYFNELILLNKKLIHCGKVDEVLRPEVILKAYEGQFSFLGGMGMSV